jgi:hypothetical protein
LLSRHLRSQRRCHPRQNPKQRHFRPILRPRARDASMISAPNVSKRRKAGEQFSASPAASSSRIRMGNHSFVTTRSIASASALAISAWSARAMKYAPW